MVDDKEDVMKTFSDYQSETDLQFVASQVTEDHPWANKLIKKLVFPPDVRAVMILRGDEKVIPKGDTQVLPGDALILVGNEYIDETAVDLTELRIDTGHYACGKRLSDIKFLNNALVVLIKRTTRSGVKTLVPNGNILLTDNDVLVMASANSKPKAVSEKSKAS
jgi:cell volume regulation protein A